MRATFRILQRHFGTGLHRRFIARNLVVKHNSKRRPFENREGTETRKVKPVGNATS